MVECAKIVEGNIVSFACDLDQGHAGPCRAKENPRSVRERAKWEEEQRILAGEPSDAQRTISEFHGQPQTTAERYTVNPTPVPKTREEIIAEQQAEAAQQVGAGFHGSTEPTLGSSSQIEQDWIEEQAREEAEEDAWRDEFGVPSEFSGEVYYDEEEDAFFRVEDSQPVEQEYEAPARMTQEEFLASQAPPSDPEPTLKDVVTPSGQVQGTSLTEGNVADVLGRVEGDLALVNAALEEEEASEKPRTTLIQKLEKEARRIRREQKKAGAPQPAQPVQNGQPAPTKQRPGDQPLPQSREGASVQDRIIAKAKFLREQGSLTEDEFAAIERSMKESINAGIQRYGTALQTFNGRDTLQDAVEEARDLFVYLSAMQQAREEEREILIEIVMGAILQANTARQEDGRASFGAEEIATVAVDAILKSTGPLVALP